jgi:DNA polymerase-3 subunit gamma/tau
VPGEHCQAIMEGRHVDVIEMDAASHTGIDDIREIIDAGALPPGLRALQGLHHRRSAHAVDAGLQRPAQDAGRTAAACEVHFATTEIRKVPITVLSRCQRFDLRRIETGAAGRPFQEVSPPRKASRSTTSRLP